MPKSDIDGVQIKVNVSGSWANLVSCSCGDEKHVKAALEVLAKFHRGSIRFKVVLVNSGDVIDQYGPIPEGNGRIGWYYKPAIQNPVQAGIDRTTSGAIGQP